MKLKYINPNRLFITIIVFSFVFCFIFSYAENAKADIAENVLRLHVIANSDSEYDQALKLKVRDRILSEAEDLFSDAISPDEALKEAKKHSDKLKSIAEDELLKNNCNDKVSVEITRCNFPYKTYGNISLPSGSYDAVRIIIGEGKGKNWWCVMFPPLCFTQGTVKIPEDTDLYLKKNLTKGEYTLITDSSSSSKIELRFKITEILSNLN